MCGFASLGQVDKGEARSGLRLGVVRIGWARCGRFGNPVEPICCGFCCFATSVFGMFWLGRTERMLLRERLAVARQSDFCFCGILDEACLVQFGTCLLESVSVKRGFARADSVRSLRNAQSEDRGGVFFERGFRLLAPALQSVEYGASDGFLVGYAVFRDTLLVHGRSPLPNRLQL